MKVWAGQAASEGIGKDLVQPLSICSHQAVAAPLTFMWPSAVGVSVSIHPLSPKGTSCTRVRPTLLWYDFSTHYIYNDPTSYFLGYYRLGLQYVDLGETQPLTLYMMTCFLAFLSSLLCSLNGQAGCTGVVDLELEGWGGKEGTKGKGLINEQV